MLTNSPHHKENETRWIREAADWKKREDLLKCVYYPGDIERKNRWLKLDLKLCGKLRNMNLPESINHKISEYERTAPMENGSKVQIAGRQILFYILETSKRHLKNQGKSCWST